MSKYGKATMKAEGPAQEKKKKGKYTGLKATYIPPKKEENQKGGFYNNAKSLGYDAAAGFTQMGSDLYNLADLIIPNEAIASILGVEDKVEGFFDRRRKEREEINQQSEYLHSKADDAVGKVGDFVVKPVAGAIPNAALALMTGGGSMGAKGAAALGTGGKAVSTGQMFANAAKDYAKKTAKNPMFWSSFGPTAGATYQEAKEEGASELEATATAILNGLAGSAIEVGGGIETLPGTKQGVREWVKSMLDEGKEEVLQGIVSNYAKKMIYDQGRKWASVDDEGAIFNPKRAAQEFAGGVTVGGILGGAQALAGKALGGLNKAANEEAAKVPGITETEQQTEQAAPEKVEVEETAESTPAGPVEKVEIKTEFDPELVQAAVEKKKVTSAGKDFDTVLSDLGEKEAFRRVYNATQITKPEGRIRVGDSVVDAEAYASAFEDTLPDDLVAVESTIEALKAEKNRQLLQMAKDGTIDDYNGMSLPVDIQLFAAERKAEALKAEGDTPEDKVRKFYESRMKGMDVNRSQELIDYLAERVETYNPIGNQETLDRANRRLRDQNYYKKLEKRILKYNQKDMFTAVDAAAAQVMINDAINMGEIQRARDLIAGLAAKGTALGQAVQILSLQARLTPEGTIKMAQRAVKKAADKAVGKEGAAEEIQQVASTIVEKVEKAAAAAAKAMESKGPASAPPPVQTETEAESGTFRDGQMVEKPEEQAGGLKPMLDFLQEGQKDAKQEGQGAAEAQQATQDAGEKESRPETPTEAKDRAGEMAEQPEPPKIEKEKFTEIVLEVLGDPDTSEQTKRFISRHLGGKDILADRLYKMYLDGELNDTACQHELSSALGLPVLTDADIEKIIELATEIQDLSENELAQADKIDELYDFLGEKIPVDKWETLQSWRKFAMLSAPLTHIRNIISNIAYRGLQKIDNATAATLENWLIKDANKKTTAWGWRNTELGKSLQPMLAEKAKVAFLEASRRGKYETGFNPLMNHRKYFGDSKVGQLVEKANRRNSNWLEKEDSWTFIPAYQDALGQLMVARSLQKPTPEVEALAMQKALEATFRADNALASLISQIKRKQNSGKKADKIAGYAADVVIPFSKTPANIVTQSVAHSPIGLVKGALDIYNATKGKGSKSAAEAINTISKGMSGTALLIIGMILGNYGIFKTGYGMTEKERAADELEGLQENALVLGDTSITLDWLQPAASPLVVGASMAQKLKEEGLTLGSVGGSVLAGVDSLFGMSMLQSLFDIFGGGMGDQGVSGSIASVLENTVSQSVPTLVGQVARAIDPVQRKTKGNNTAETTINRVLAKIPGLTYLLDPELDVWGNTVYRTGKASAGSAALNAMQQFLIPSKIKIGTGAGDEISEEITRLYGRDEGKKYAAAIPSTISKDDARDKGLDFIEDNRQLGRVNRKIVEKLMQNKEKYTIITTGPDGKQVRVEKYYRDMTDDERRKVLSRLLSKGKREYLEGDQEKDDYFQNILGRLGNGN